VELAFKFLVRLLEVVGSLELPRVEPLLRLGRRLLDGRLGGFGGLLDLYCLVVDFAH
jgi:hypothetical protein